MNRDLDVDRTVRREATIYKRNGKWWYHCRACGHDAGGYANERATELLFDLHRAGPHV